MEKKEDQTEHCSVWIDWKKRIISFEAAEGFEKLESTSHKEMLDFAVQKSMAGFGIQ